MRFRSNSGSSILGVGISRRAGSMEDIRCLSFSCWAWSSSSRCNYVKIRLLWIQKNQTNQGSQSNLRHRNLKQERSHEQSLQILNTFVSISSWKGGSTLATSPEPQEVTWKLILYKTNLHNKKLHQRRNDACAAHQNCIYQPLHKTMEFHEDSSRQHQKVDKDLRSALKNII